MPDVPPDYVAEMYRQTAFVSAVLGGFAVAFLGALLASAAERRVVTTAIGFTAAAAVLFAVGTLASVFLLLDVLRLGIRSFDFSQWSGSAFRTKTIADTALFAGVYALVVGVGLSGWARSRQTGRVTATVAAAGFVLLSLVLASAC